MIRQLLGSNSKPNMKEGTLRRVCVQQGHAYERLWLTFYLCLLEDGIIPVDK